MYLFATHIFSLCSISSDLLPIILTVSFLSSFYGLGMSPLSDLCFANIFSQSITCLSVLTTFLEEQAFVTFIKYNLPICSCMGFAFSVVASKST